MAKNTHLTLEDRIIIEVSLKNGESFAEIGRKLEKILLPSLRKFVIILRSFVIKVIILVQTGHLVSKSQLYVNLALLNSAIYANVALNIAVMNFVQISLN
ncbi:MAG: helix-turn-helix domain-containing protein [Mediterraneibacter faecis]